MRSHLSRVVLSLPSLLSLMTTTDTADAPRSWIQLAKTGTFHSTRYGKFSITKDDLAQMLHNFRHVTPAAPTELPIDYDHLSMDPKKPGDGIAAGWLKSAELRADGDELWGEVEWTPEASGLIQNRAYRFISPSFVKDHTHKDGRKIGTTLLAAALTNHPFLESMKAVTLYSFSAMGDLALVDAPITTAPVHLADLGQRVTFPPDAERTPELTEEERRQTFVIKATIGEGDDQFVRLTKLDGTEFGWFRSTQLAPAPAPEPERTKEHTPMQHMKTTENDIQQKASTFLRRLPKNYTVDDVLRLSRQYPDEGEAYRLAGIGIEQLEPAPASAPISLSVREGETFDDVAHRYAEEHGVPLRQAVREVGKARPDLAAVRG